MVDLGTCGRSVSQVQIGTSERTGEGRTEQQAESAVKATMLEKIEILKSPSVTRCLRFNMISGYNKSVW